MTYLQLFTTNSKMDIEDLIYAMSDLADSDFNGENGEEYTSDEALNKGFESDRDYAVQKLLEKYKEETPNETTLTNIVYDYCKMAFADTDYYKEYEVSCYEVNDMFIVAVAYVS